MEISKSKSIAILGRARTGKSFLVSRFVDDKAGFTDLFCGASSDKTVCPIYITISNNLDKYKESEKFLFKTNFNKIHEDEKDEEVIELKKEISLLLKEEFSQKDPDKNNKMEKIEDIIGRIKSREQEYPNTEKSEIYIESFQKPSKFSKKIMEDCELEEIKIIDTPGVSGNIDAVSIQKSDIYIFLLRPDNSEESQTLLKIVSQIKAEVATSKVAFLYKREGIFTSAEKYKEGKEKASNDMKSFDGLFKDFRGSIISTQRDVLNPSENCIMFPTMDEKEDSDSEKLFLKDMEMKLEEVFNQDKKDKKKKQEDEEFKKIISEEGLKAREFILKIMSEMPKHTSKKMGLEYSIDQLKQENHDRVKSKDNYRFYKELYNAYREEMDILDEYFSDFKYENFKCDENSIKWKHGITEKWKHTIIKYIYDNITDSVKTDRGLGVGTHHMEDRPARTMLVEESILANEILSNYESLKKSEGLESLKDLRKTEKLREIYKKTFTENKIDSSSWNYVYFTSDEDAIIKLNIIKECLSNIPVYSSQEMVLFRYIGGLRKLAQYKILEKMGYEESDCMEKLKNLPF